MRGDNKKISVQAAASMAALLALDDLENGRIKQAKISLNFLVDRLAIDDLKDHVFERLNKTKITYDKIDCNDEFKNGFSWAMKEICLNGILIEEIENKIFSVDGVGDFNRGANHALNIVNKML